MNKECGTADLAVRHSIAIDQVLKTAALTREFGDSGRRVR